MRKSLPSDLKSEKPNNIKSVVYKQTFKIYIEAKKYHIKRERERWRKRDIERERERERDKYRHSPL